MFRRAFLSARRCYSTGTTPPKSSLKLVAELRKLTEVSIIKAREALTATNNDITAALDWLQKDLVTSGAKKAAKVDGRATEQGLIGTCILSKGPESHTLAGVRAAMIELNCETDFVGRGELFSRLAGDIAYTLAFLAEPNTPRFPLDFLKDAPLLAQATPNATPTNTVASAIRNLIAKVGENVSLRRAIAMVENPSRGQTDVALRLASYVHGAINQPTQGRMGTLALLALNNKNLSEKFGSDNFRNDLDRLERSLARQLVGFETHSIDSSTDSETALYSQPFMMYPGELSGQPVREVLRKFSEEHGLVDGDTSGIAVLSYEKWTVGESLETPVN